MKNTIYFRKEILLYVQRVFFIIEYIIATNKTLTIFKSRDYADHIV